MRVRASSLLVLPRLQDNVLDEGELGRDEELGEDGEHSHVGVDDAEPPEEGEPHAADQGQREVRGGQHQQHRDDGLQGCHADHGAPLIPAVHEHAGERAHHNLWDGGRQDDATDGQRCPGLTRDQGGHPEHESGIPGIISHTGDGLPPPEQGEVPIDEGRPGEVLQPPAQ